MTTASPPRASGLTQRSGALIGSELDAVERRLTELLRSQEPLLTDIADYLVHSGGKRVRPAVTIIAFRTCGGEDIGPVVDAAAALELIHSATLLHDDIIDGSGVRRGKASALRRYGLGNTLVTGDFLFSRAFQVCGQFDKILIEWAAEACISLTEGEVLQSRFRRHPAATVEDYMEIITRKTACLFATGARTGAYLAGAASEHLAAMSECGFQVGLTFQMIDDVLDIASDEAKLGKPIGIDLRDGNPSLPIVLAVQDDPEVRRVFEDEAPAESAIAGALRRIRQSNVLDRVRHLASEHADRARAALRTLPESAYREHFIELIDQLVARPS